MVARSRGRRSVAATAGTLLLLSTAAFASSRERAASHYRKASQLYEDLLQVPQLELGTRQYELVISAFESVPRADPASGFSDDALMRAAELYEQMAARFDQARFRAKAAETFRFLAREYPHSKYRAEALGKASRIGGPVTPEIPVTQLPESDRTDGSSRSVGVAALSDSSHEAGAVVDPPDSGIRRGDLSEISELRHHSYDDGTRIVVTTEAKTALKYDRLSRPARLYIDMFNSKLSTSLIDGVNVSIGDSLLARARLAQNRANKARLVLDLNGPVSFDAFWLAGPVRLVLDVRAAGSPRLPRTKMALEGSAVPREAPRAAEATADGRHSFTRALGLKLDRILIDPGHGGHDTGSIGPRGLKEKDVVLDVAKRLGELLRERLGAEVHFTRTSDVFVPLEDRTKTANDKGADLMISIHCNSARTSSVRGIETYYLDLTTDAWELSVASAENAAATRSIHELEGLLSKIARRDNIDESKELAAMVQSRLYRGLSRHSASIKNRGVRKAPFIVLVDAEMPAVLAEIGFISNRTDEGLMRRKTFRQETAEHLFSGIAAYAESLGAGKSLVDP